MMRVPVLMTLPLLAAFAAAPAFAQSSSATMASMPGMAAPDKSPADQAMAVGMAAMNKGMATARMTGAADQDFVAMMILHHQGAVFQHGGLALPEDGDEALSAHAIAIGGGARQGASASASQAVLAGRYSAV